MAKRGFQNHTKLRFQWENIQAFFCAIKGNVKDQGQRTTDDESDASHRKLRLGGTVAALLLLTCLATAADKPKRRTRRMKSSPPVSNRLRVLGKQSGEGRISAQMLSQLRRQAESEKRPEQRGRAYFLLGYREYEAAQYPAGMKDLQVAAATQFTLEDYADFYQAAAAVQGHQPALALAPLQGFPAHYPESPLRHQSIALLAQAATEASQPDLAIQALAADPRLHQEPAHLYLLEQAQEKAEKWLDAARTGQEIYYRFPTAPEASAAQQAMAQLRRRLGGKFPEADEGTQSARPEALYEHRRYQDALREYEALARKWPRSPQAELWRVRRAQCVIELKQAHRAAEALEAEHPLQAEVDAERLATLADAYERLNDPAALTRTLDQLSAAHPQSSFRASALRDAASFFARQADWAMAARYDHDLAAAFPDSLLGTEASWRSAWMTYLEKQPARARQDLADHVVRYPASAQNAAAVYWLGRISEESGEYAEARAFYQLVRKRYTQSYYATEADQCLQRLKGRQDTTGENGADASLPARLAETLAPPASSASLCMLVDGGSSEAALDRFKTLHALHLDGLSESYLRQMLADHPASAELRYALSRFEAEQGETQEGIYEARNLEPDYSDFKFDALPEEIWALLYPHPYWAMVKQQAQVNGLDPFLVMGLIRQESGFDPHATSVANARGLMQMLPSTAVLESPAVVVRAKKPGGRARKLRPSTRVVARQLYDPAYNIRLACRYLRGLFDEFHGNASEVMAAYNAGDSRVKEWLARGFPSDAPAFVETIPIGDTRVYVKAVLRDAAIYRGLLTKSPQFKRCG